MLKNLLSNARAFWRVIFTPYIPEPVIAATILEYLAKAGPKTTLELYALFPAFDENSKPHEATTLLHVVVILQNLEFVGQVRCQSAPDNQLLWSLDTPKPRRQKQHRLHFLGGFIPSHV